MSNDESAMVLLQQVVRVRCAVGLRGCAPPTFFRSRGAALFFRLVVGPPNGSPHDTRGRLPERPMGADCKSVGFAFEGSNPSPATRDARPRTGNCAGPP